MIGATEEPGTRRDNIAFDFDGVLHEHPGYRATFGAIDLNPIRLAHERGLAASVMTCNDLHRVAAVLRRGGFRVFVDADMRHLFWDGGYSGTTVLVTGRKVSAIGYLDDKGYNARHGETDFSDLIFRVIEDSVDRREASKAAAS